ncbi:16S rRNA (cytosine(967)-C(5))-methyltransferase RsmB [Fredinandcohnia quinoae]|uniref:16S rRNA (cytosine(967)-C(5))-methyltransferase n=1 Tax=Fredinandcohnia quinoae TaxID=2918902 RepID=A0AAW5E137_9BACI|nr:16S rRNA (cytosine(967)-C(5))-methyltransferase RsmB [Fredinandcohnia sp. SECRCQ15]MCH1623832.1 16S rRNA (cytosine(967)-C(5))-methyltransferase RsmB [Fredinandcohnia sp. SECRCQ15]
MKRNNVRDAALEILLMIEKNQAYSNLLLTKIINKREINGKDIGLLTEIVYGTLQRRDTIDYFLTPFLKNKKIDIWVQNLLRLSLYQIIYLDRVPERAIFFEAVEIAKKRGHKGISSFVNGVLRSIQREGVPSIEQISDPLKRLSIETSHPLWLVTNWVNQFGFDETKKMCEVNITPPEQTARINSNISSVENVLQLLEGEGIEAVRGDLSDDSIKAIKGNLAHTKAFADGYFTIQDESSMLVARALGIKKGDDVLDSCAAPGGKTTHIAELLQNTGSVLSLDLHEHKTKLINDQVSRLKLNNVNTRALDSRQIRKFYQDASFDKILVDAPCSGYGVIRRKPDIKYSKQEIDSKKLASIQLEILSEVATLLKKDGILVYSTCTIGYEENQGVITEFLRNNSEFELDNELAACLPKKMESYVKNGQVQLLPHYFGTDGFYIARLRKQV